MTIKAYVITSGAIFGLLTIMHILRIIMENRHLASDPPFILLTLVSAVLFGWAVQVFRSLKS